MDNSSGERFSKDYFNAINTEKSSKSTIVEWMNEFIWRVATDEIGATVTLLKHGLQQSLPSTELNLYSDEDINDMYGALSNLNPVDGTMKIHEAN